MDAHPDAAMPTVDRIDEPSVAERIRPSSRPAPTARDETAAQLRARLLRLIVMNEKARKSHGGEGSGPR
jgi:hypothetical protein